MLVRMFVFESSSEPYVEIYTVGVGVVVADELPAVEVGDGVAVD